MNKSKTFKFFNYFLRQWLQGGNCVVQLGIKCERAHSLLVHFQALNWQKAKLVQRVKILIYLNTSLGYPVLPWMIQMRF